MISDSVMLNYQTEKFQYWQQKIKTSCRIINTVSQRTPQTLTRPHPGPPRRCGIVLSLKFSWRRIIKQSCKVSIVPGAIPGFADDHDDVEQRLISKNDWYVYNFHSQFIFGCYSGEKRLFSTLRLVVVHHSHHELAVSHSRRAGVAGERVRRASGSGDCSRRRERSGGLLMPAREVRGANSRWRAGSTVAASHSGPE